MIVARTSQKPDNKGERRCIHYLKNWSLDKISRDIKSKYLWGCILNNFFFSLHISLFFQIFYSAHEVYLLGRNSNTVVIYSGCALQSSGGDFQKIVAWVSLQTSSIKIPGVG